MNKPPWPEVVGEVLLYGIASIIIKGANIMKKPRLLGAMWGGVFFAYLPLAHAALVEVGDLNIINDAGNPSDGLRYLDMTYSDGLTQAAALTNAQATYANARLATASEFDDLFGSGWHCV
jgi:hypothetical protein